MRDKLAERRKPMGACSALFNMGISFLMFIFHLQLSFGELLDFATVYRFENKIYPPSEADVEFHTHTNALGVLRVGDPIKGNIRGMSPLNCVPANSNCSWEKSGTWVTEMSTVPNITASSPFFSKSCTNGELCHAYCQNSICSCGNFAIGRNGKCYPRSTIYYVIEDFPGDISVQCTSQYWLIIAPLHTRIQLNITALSTICEGSLVIYGYSQNGQQQSYYQMNVRSIKTYSFVSNNHVVFIDASGYNRYGPNYQNSDIARIHYEFLSDYLSLKSETGTLSYSAPVLGPNICLSVLYKPGPGPVSVKVDTTSQIMHRDFSEECSIKYQNIFYCRYRAALSSSEKSQTIPLNLHVYGINTVIYRISECNPYSDVDIIYIERVNVTSAFQQIRLHNEWGVKSQKPVEICHNGGKYIDTYNECQCPAGFTGQRCEEGCGPNRYGRDCRAMCSNFKWGCRGMTFCKRDLPCLCAPGYKNQYCEEPCSSGNYGAECQNKCGMCKNGTCNIFTGKCDSECVTGFYPPLCQDTYKYATNIPYVLYQNISLAHVKLKVSDTKGSGNIIFWQLQYKVNDSSKWEKGSPQIITGEYFSDNAADLSAGVIYQARVVGISEDGNSYEGDLIPVLEFVSLCDIPTSEQFMLSPKHASEAIIEVYLKYDKHTHDCPLTEYELVIQKEWQTITKTVSISENTAMFNQLLSGMNYDIKVRGKGNFGATPYSSTITVKTEEIGPSEVRNLSSNIKTNKILTVSWETPLYTGGEIQNYVVKFQCIRLLSCNETCNYSKGELHVKNSPVEVKNLIAHAQYTISVGARAQLLGAFTNIIARTGYSEPNVAPGSSETPVVHRTNTSFAVQWTFPDNCSLLNGYFEKYRYELRDDASAESGRVIQFGYTGRTNATFRNLSPLTTYYVHVYVVTSGGWNPDIKRVISVTTTATVPEAVRDLAAYKTSRRTIDVRWAPPSRSYGAIKSFVVSYQQVHAGRPNTEIISPQRCLAWPDFFCYSIDKLLPHKSYLITVSARNEYVDGDGAPSVITAKTFEGAPSAPVGITLIKRTPTSLSLKWGPPFMMNGEIRSFLLNIEQVDSLNMDDCCDYFPLTEVPVIKEQREYTAEVADLQPASTYVVSVSGKTVTIGPSINITLSLPPLPPLLSKEPEVDTDFDGSLLVKLYADEESYNGLKSTYLLLMLSEEKVADPQIADLELAEQLDNLTQSLAGGLNYYIVAEYTREQLLVTKETIVATGVENRNGTWSILQDPLLETGTYRVGLALVLEYANAKSVGLVVSEPFDV